MAFFLRATTTRTARRKTLVLAKSGEVEVTKLPAKTRDGVLSAIEQLGNKVTVGDVAAKTGLKLSEAEAGLVALASDTLATLQVSDKGDVVYVFPDNPRAAILAKSFRLRYEPLLKKIQNGFGWLLRVSFGTTLIASLVIVFAAIQVVIATAQNSSENNNRSSSRGMGGMGMGGPRFFFNPMDMFLYSNPSYNRRREKKEGEMNFFEAVFSFVFGDGDPNQMVEETRWAQVGELISSKGGVVAAEQLAPYLEGWPNRDPTSFAGDESFVVEVMQRFDGHPDVDDDGNLLYRFPTLQTTAVDAGQYRFSSREKSGAKYLLEENWQLTLAGPGQKFAAVALGAVNLGGVAFLTYMLGNPEVVRAILYQSQSQGAATALQGVVAITPFLQGYAASFFAIPLWRTVSNKIKNAAIDKRNALRQASAALLQDPDAPLRVKLSNAKKATGKIRVMQDGVVFDSSKDVGDSMVSLDADEGRDFDERLNRQEIRQEKTAEPQGRNFDDRVNRQERKL